jgi:hypothetical protein
MTPAPQKEYIITEKMLKFFASQSFACEQIAATARLHTSARIDAVLDKAKAKLDGYYKSLPAHHPYLDGIDMSIQKIEELQEELKQQERP